MLVCSAGHSGKNEGGFKSVFRIQGTGYMSMSMGVCKAFRRGLTRYRTGASIILLLLWGTWVA